MAKFGEMRNAALRSQREFDGTRDRAWKCFERIIQGLFTHCDVPFDNIRFLKWNGKFDEGRAYRPADSGNYTLQGAASFDESDGYWHLGLSVHLTQVHFILFVLCYSELDGSPRVKLGPKGKPEVLSLESEESLGAYCESICDAGVRAYSEPTSSEPRAVGFGTNE